MNVPSIWPGKGTRWTSEALSALEANGFAQAEAPLITAGQAAPMSPDLDVWDAWPLADPSGQPLRWRDGELWFALAAARGPDPEDRHHLARIHHFHRQGDRFVHLGETLPDGFTPGSREWSGSARYEDGIVTLFFTAAGYLGDRSVTYHQRIFATTAAIETDGLFGEWTAPHEIIAADGTIYRPADQNEGEPGKIKAFRDPGHYRGADGLDYLVFTGSSAQAAGSHDGLVGLAVRENGGDYRLLPPLIEACGANNELERPHIVETAGRLYLFWSTQRSVFAPGICAPTGLYGATATSLDGTWELLNGHGLVVANPVTRPHQTYSWWVLPDFSVASFVDYWTPEDAALSGAAGRRARFGGTFAPFLHIEVDGANTRLVRGEQCDG